jgi:hypothetical protein
MLIAHRTCGDDKQREQSWHSKVGRNATIETRTVRNSELRTGNEGGDVSDFQFSGMPDIHRIL